MGSRTKSISSIISCRIKALRSNNGLTQRELAETLFKSESTVRMWELGKSEPDLQTLKQLSDIFNVSVDYILGKTDIPIKQQKPADEGELSEDIIIYHRDGKTVKQKFTKKQMDTILMMIDAMVEKPKDI